MKIDNTHLTYCSNIHGGETWEDHFNQLKANVPQIKASISPNQSFGLGLRLSARACEDLLQEENLHIFQAWLTELDVYVFTMNGFPYGDFHLHRVKENVHAPDWTTKERLQYTKNMFQVLAKLLPTGLEGGISTSPLSYRFWHNQDTEAWEEMISKSTNHIIEIAEQLHEIERTTGKILHLDIEPEPDGVLENGVEFVQWYQADLLPKAYTHFHAKYHYDQDTIKALINKHIQLCYDVCHAAVEFESHQEYVRQLATHDIKIGKFQISSALKIALQPKIADRLEKREIIQEFNEQIYLHQVVAKHIQGHLSKYRDIDEALPHLNDLSVTEWRSHFHVPIFMANYGQIESTQKDIIEVLTLHQSQPLTQHIEVETYTWNVLPTKMQLPMDESIIRELKWLKNIL